MSLSWSDKFYLGGVFAGTFTGGGLVGSLVLSDAFNIASYLTYGTLTALGAGVGMDYFNRKFAPEAKEPAAEEKNPWIRKEEKVLTQAEQNEIFKVFMKKSGVLMGGFLLGAVGGILTGYLTMSAVNYMMPPADTSVKQGQVERPAFRP